jgi:amino acid efflux transporter
VPLGRPAPASGRDRPRLHRGPGRLPLRDRAGDEGIAAERGLARTLSLPQAIGLGITIVVGSGLLIVPGLAYASVGSAAVYVWILDAALVVPLLVIFAYLGARYPSAGGIAGFVGAAFGRRGGAATEVLLLGTFGLGIPAISITGASYFAELVGGGTGATAAATFALLALSGAVNVLGTRVSGRMQQLLAVVLVLLLAGAAVAALLAGGGHGGHYASPVHVHTWRVAASAIGVVFFAYTGWEMLSFTAEEYQNPRRDFPLAIAGSFLAVLGLYLLVAFAVQSTLTREEARHSRAPVGAMLGVSLGGGSGRFVAAVGVLIIGANLVGAVWAASRLVFASAREGLLPHVLTSISGRSVPAVSVVATSVGFSAIAVAHFLHVVSLQTLLRLAGQNFFILYGLSVVAFLRLTDRLSYRLFGLAALAVTVVAMGTFGWTLLYPAALLALGAVAAAWVRPRAAEAEPA